MMFKLSSTLLLAAGAISASAQSLSSISSQCQSTLQSVATSSEATCINAASLVSLALTGSNSSIIQPLTTWLSGACSQDACSNQTISDIVTNITTGCSSDLSSLGFSTDNSSVSALIAEVQRFYPTVREVVCLQDNNANELCVTELLTDVQNSVGTLSTDNIMTIAEQVSAGSSSISSSLLQNVTCSDCVKAAVQSVNSSQPGLITSSLTSDLSSECGAAFVNGSSPSEISQTAEGLSTKSDSSSASHLVAFGPAVASLIALASGFLAFA